MRSILSEEMTSEVGFTDRERLLGDSALAQIKSNAKILALKP